MVASNLLYNVQRFSNIYYSLKVGEIDAESELLIVYSDTKWEVDVVCPNQFE